MSVFENLQMGAFGRRGAKIDDDVARVYDLFPRLRERRSQKAGTMSGGEQQMLAMGRALMARPTILLLDEPSMGLSPILTEQIFRIPGIGRALIDGIATKDVPVVMAITFGIAVLVVIFNLIADILYTVLDPRIRYD